VVAVAATTEASAAATGGAAAVAAGAVAAWAADAVATPVTAVSAGNCTGLTCGYESNREGMQRRRGERNAGDGISGDTLATHCLVNSD
jgi:phage tail sheath gpL-like